MGLWRHLARGVRVLTDRTAADREIADEVQDYLDRATDAALARGLSPDAARRAARRDLGNPVAVREQVRGYGWENLVSTLLADLRYAARRLRARPGFRAARVSALVVKTGGSGSRGGGGSETPASM